MRYPTCAAICVVVLAALGTSQQPTWTQAQPASAPIARSHHAVAFDSVRGRTVLFGGVQSLLQPPLSDTWEWNGSDWSLRTPLLSPPARLGHAMAFDSVRGRTVLFGGSGLADTWEWDGTNWIQHTPTTAPPALFGHGMVYDSARQRTLLFGATYVPGSPRMTWEWDGTNWTQRTPTTSPPVGHEFALAYDSTRGRTVLFGGYTGVFLPPLDETWEWDGATWTKLSPAASPLARQGHSMAFDVGGQRTVMFGGIQGTAETWQWDGTNWTLVGLTTTPSMRDHAAMAHDSVRRETVLFGGNPTNSDTWIYQQGAITATFTTIGNGCGSPAATLAASAGSRPLLGAAFSLDSTNLPAGSTTGFMTIGLTRITPIGLSPIGMGGCFLYHSYDAVLAFPLTLGAGTFTIRVPSVSSLAGQKLVFQSAAGFVASNGGEALFGTQ